MPMPPELSLKDLFQVLPGAGLTGALLLFIWGGMRRVWVWGYQLEDSKSREQAWKDEARRNAEMAEQAREMTKQALEALRVLQDERRGRGRS